MTYSAIAAANYFIKLARRDKEELTALKLIKHGFSVRHESVYPLVAESATGKV